MLRTLTLLFGFLLWQGVALASNCDDDFLDDYEDCASDFALVVTGPCAGAIGGCGCVLASAAGAIPTFVGCIIACGAATVACVVIIGIQYFKYKRCQRKAFRKLTQCLMEEAQQCLGQ